MKFIKSLLPVIALVLLGTACKKHVIEYDSIDLPKDYAEFQLHYFNPVATGAANNITKVEVDGKLLTNATTALAVYNAVPSGAVGRFFTAPAKKTNFKLYRGTNQDLVYDRDITLIAGKQNIFVHDFNADAVVLSNLYPYPTHPTDTTGSFTWIRFYNFMYESAGVPTPKILQYQFQYNMDPEKTNQMSEWANLGNPVRFGEATTWVEVPVIKAPSAYMTQGTARIEYRILEVGPNGENLGVLQTRKSNGTYSDFTDYWTATIGRVYHHIFRGMRTADPVTAISQFTAK